MPILYVMIGLQGSGKSTFADSHQECVTICLDEIRKELFGDASIQKDGYKVFQIGKERVEKALSLGKDVIYDATNLTAKTRKWCFNTNAKHIAVFVNTPLNECKRRNANRNRQVPEAVIDKAFAKLQPPSLEEGFDEVMILNN